MHRLHIFIMKFAPPKIFRHSQNSVVELGINSLRYLHFHCCHSSTTAALSSAASRIQCDPTDSIESIRSLQVPQATHIQYQI